MGRFSLSGEKAGEGNGNVDAVSVVSRWLQDVSAEKLRSRPAASSLSFSSIFRALRLPESVVGNNRSGFVTIGDYLWSERETPNRGFAEMQLVQSQVNRAGKRATNLDANRMKALGGGRKAGRDAGKGAFELTAGSLVERTTSAARKDSVRRGWHGWKRKKSSEMLTSEFRPFRLMLMGLSVACFAAIACPAGAFDIKSGVTKESGPFDLFKFGFKAYKNGQKEEAVEAYKYAAEKGHTGSRWALANMYADGDGVTQNDFEAFKIYSEIAQQGVEPGSEDTGFFVNALLSLANYYKHGIPGSPVKTDLSQARQLYFQVASTFGVPEAQFQLAQMMLAGEGGGTSAQQAKKWLNQARKSGHPGAMAVFGNILFQEGQAANGLALMTAALDRCKPKDCSWMESLQEQAFSVATENDRRTAISMSHKIATSNTD
jgi:TPR repeat protein